MHLFPFARSGIAALLLVLLVPVRADSPPPDPRSAWERREMAPVRTWLNAVEPAGPESVSLAALRARAWLARRERHGERALELLAQAIDRAPGRADLRVDRAEFRSDRLDAVGPLGKLKIARQVREDLEAAIRAQPEDIETRVALATFHLQAPGLVGGRRERGQQLLDALEHDAPARAEAVRALVAAGNGDHERAVERIQRAIDASAAPPPKWLLRLGQWQSAQGNVSGARRAFERALELAPAFTPAAIELARLALEHSGDGALQRAIAALEPLAGQTPFPDDAPAAERWRLLAGLYRAAGRAGSADRALARAEAAERQDTGPAPGAGEAGF